MKTNCLNLSRALSLKLLIAKETLREGNESEGQAKHLICLRTGFDFLRNKDNSYFSFIDFQSSQCFKDKCNLL